MKRKSLLTLLLAVILCAIVAIPVFASDTSVVGVPEYIANWGGEEYFFANGAAITVEERTDGVEGALVKWNENGVEKSQVLGTVSNIFGGMHDNDTPVKTSITINGGYVNWIHGGGLHRSHTTSSNIVMNGGQVGMIKGGGADQWVPGSANCGCTGTDRTWIPGDYENSPSQTEEANITINGGKIEKISGASGTVFGGGNGYANTKSANITVAGGDLSNAVVSGGGSNGNTDEASITITAGTMDIVQSVNRGTMKSAKVTVTGGTIENLYVAAQNADDATGTITGTVEVDITGKADVKELALGKNGGTIVDSTTSTVVKPENITIAAGTVKELEGNIDSEVTIVYQVTIDEKVYLVKPGDTIKDIPEYKDIIKKDGYKFVEFKSSEGTWNEDEELKDDLKLTTVFDKEEEKTEENITTDGNNNTTGGSAPGEGSTSVEENNTSTEGNTIIEGNTTTAISIFAVVAVISAAGLILTKKRNK